ncbi:MAG: FAD-dependent oxidoreductase [Treponema sp.]|nr:FAD-dependent oxidoreductase [Treponema sp.]
MSGFYNMKHTVYKETIEIPVMGNFDVIVVGGGPAGIASALAASRHGMHVLVVESYGFLGGMWTMGMVVPFFDQENKGGICYEIVGALNALNMIKVAGPDMWAFDIEQMKLLLDRMLLKEDITLLFHTHFTTPIIENGKIMGIVVENKNGRSAYNARIVIDCTGDGDVAARAGVPFEIGRPEDGSTQPMTLMFQMSNVAYVQDYYKYHHYVDNELIQKLQDAMVRAGVMNYQFNYLRPCIIPVPGIYTSICQATHIRNLSAINSEDLTQAELQGREEVNKLFHLFKTYMPEFTHAHIDTSGPHIGIRESRRIMGEYKLTIDDIEQSRQFDDGICTVTFWVDIHQPDGDNQSKQYGKLLQPHYQIPYRCLVPLNVENLLIAGRCISGSFEAHASYRVTGNCVAMGYAAGVAASICIKSNISPRTTDGCEVVTIMTADGAVCRAQR